GAPFTDVVKVARAVKRLCDDMELPSFPKTSGQSGMHVLLPLGAACTYVEARSFAELVSRVVAAELPEISTMIRVIGARGGRVYLDYLQNGHGRLLVAPFSVRPVPGARVSTPLRWDEVTSRLDPAKLTIRTVPERLERMKQDPMAAVLTEKP